MTGRSVIFVALTCSATRHPGVGRFVRDEDGWALQGASRQRPGTTIPASDGRAASGTFYSADDYAGCPSCAATGFVRCAACSNLGCWDERSTMFTCPTCGRRGPVAGTIDSIASMGSG
jgi:hypothetical protein